MGPQAMEGNPTVSRAPGCGPQAIRLRATTPPDLTVSNAEVVFDIRWATGLRLANLRRADGGQSYSLTGSQWYPSGDQSSPLVYQGSAAVPDLCGGGSLDLAQGGTFTATLS